jgi:hypothetical protein
MREPFSQPTGACWETSTPPREVLLSVRLTPVISLVAISTERVAKLMHDIYIKVATRVPFLDGLRARESHDSGRCKYELAS